MVQSKPKFDKRKLQSLELSTFFHPAFLEGCGYIAPDDANARRGYLLLSHAIFFRTAEDAGKLWALMDEIFRPEPERQGDESAQEEWLRRAREHCEQDAIKTLGDLVEAGGVYGARKVLSFTHRHRPALAQVGNFGIRRVVEVMHYFGYRSFAHENRPKIDVETEKALAAVKLVIKP